MKFHFTRFTTFIFIIFFSFLFTPYTTIYSQQQHSSEINVLIITDEADAVLAILHKINSKGQVTEEDWQKLFTSEGYTRLKKREISMHHIFSETDFKNFVLSNALINHISALENTLYKWKNTEIAAVARKPLAYLPEGSGIHAKVYPVIKPLKNSFVFDLNDDPAIFLFIDTLKSKEQFENTVAHELHHIGFAENCKDTDSADDTTGIKAVISWIGAFGEGFAMIAAAGGPDIHPHLYSSPEDRARWDKDVSDFNTNLKLVEQFFIDLLDNKLTKGLAEETGFSFFGIQGPWYTVGWKMSVVIEKVFGREKLIECIQNQKLLLHVYNDAVVEYNKKYGSNLVSWSGRLISNITPQK